jgi:farnesyl-diphosphate farnesyltransferase
MGIFAILELAIKHPEELRAMVTYKVWRDPLNDIKSNPEESGWSRETMRDCWTLLDQTSRSFAAVIKELKGQLSRFICIFYLVLRALDTIEDDMTIEPERKIQLLVNFYKKLEEPGWNFTESRWSPSYFEKGKREHETDFLIRVRQADPMKRTDICSSTFTK